MNSDSKFDSQNFQLWMCGHTVGWHLVALPDSITIWPFGHATARRDEKEAYFEQFLGLPTSSCE